MARSVFEEVGDAKQQPAGGQSGPKTGPKSGPGGARQTAAANRHAVRLWLLILAALVVLQIVVGGLTRLTDSGLSIVEWRPVTGVIPPLSEAAWETELEKYRSTTEYQEQNRGMSLAEFKVIYWWEWGHRMGGRLIGLVFIGGLALFALRKQIPPGWMGRILFVGGLGALQGVIGWWMVASGLTGRLDVSQHRLAVHLGLAFIILALLLWYALGLKREPHETLQARRRREPGLPALAYGLGGLAFLQIIMGAYVAGMDGGLVYAEWPLMGGALYPPGEPFAPFTEPAAAQFIHRLLGYLVLVAGVFFFWRARGSGHAKTKLWGTIVLGVIGLQVVIGIAALTQGVPIWLGALHQLGGVLVAGALVHAAHQIAYPAEEKLTA